MVTLKPITIKFEHTKEFDIEAYLDWCDWKSIQPSQKNYKKWAVDCLVDSLIDNIDTDEFQFIYDNPREFEYEESKEETFSYASYVSDLTEEELQEFHKLVEMSKININPIYTKDDIITMNSIENPSLDYGVKINKETGEILYIKKSIYTHHLYEYLGTLEKPAQGHSTDAP